MILNEYFGNLQAISPKILKPIFDKYGPSAQKYLGKDSKVEIVKNDKIKDIVDIPIQKSSEYPIIILRYGQEDKVVFVANDYGWNHQFSEIDKRWKKYFTKHGIYFNEGFDENLKCVWENGYKDEIPDFNDFLNKINYQVVYRDKERDDKQVKRTLNRGDILKVQKKKKDWRYTDKNTPSKVHGSLIDSRDTSDYYKSDLQKRLKKYVESKFPTFNSYEDFINADIKTILKAFKIGNNLYNYSHDATMNVMKGNDDPLYALYKNKKTYIGYYCYNCSDNLPSYIYFEIVMDINNNIKVSEIYGSHRYYKEYFKPLSKWFKKDDETKSKEKIIDDNDDW